MIDRKVVIEESETKVSIMVTAKGNRQDAKDKEKASLSIALWGIDMLLGQVRKELGIKEEPDGLNGFLESLLDDLKSKHEDLDSSEEPTVKAMENA